MTEPSEKAIRDLRAMSRTRGLGEEGEMKKPRRCAECDEVATLYGGRCADCLHGMGADDVE